MKEEKLYQEIGRALKKAEESQLFGKPCFKINGKAFICFFENSMVFKLKDDFHAEALGLKNAKLFDPSGKKRPMKEWVQLPYEHSKVWPKFVTAAFNYVSSSK